MPPEPPAERGREPASTAELLAAAVTALGGVTRDGQAVMAAAVDEAVAEERHLLVQAGTGTGKSLAYLVPALRHAVSTGSTVVVSTATLALQDRLVRRDLPLLADALAPLLGRRPTWERAMGRANYACRHKLDGGFPVEEDGLFEAPTAPRPRPGTALGRDVVRLQEWARRSASGERPELVPGVADRLWRSVSVTAEECLGAARCPHGADCFVEAARERARHADVVVTNHALLAIDAFDGRALLPEHDLLVVDEAHELADRVTSVVTDRLTVAAVEAAARSASRAGAEVEDLQEAASGLAAPLGDGPVGRLPDGLPDAVATPLAIVRDAARAVLGSLPSRSDGAADGARSVARADVGEVFDVADRLLSERPGDVLWVEESGRRARSLHVAPLSVAGLLRTGLFADRTAILTSATLALGGTFDAVASAVGLSGPSAPPWRSLDVGSPFDYARQAVLYVARELPPPGRDGASPAAVEELVALVEAARGGTLGLFSSRRAAEQAADVLRERTDLPVLCQGDDLTSTLVQRFSADERSCLLGTLSLWQGVDVPGRACRLVVIDRIPFPRPDEPLAAARQRAVEQAGGNGFLAVAVASAALLLAQGVGRLVRQADDRGVVAVLDPRLVTARYGPLLTASLPPMWRTTSRDVVLGVLQRLAAADAGPRSGGQAAGQIRRSTATTRPRMVAASPSIGA